MFHHIEWEDLRLQDLLLAVEICQIIHRKIDLHTNHLLLKILGADPVYLLVFSLITVEEDQAIDSTHLKVFKLRATECVQDRIVSLLTAPTTLSIAPGAVAKVKVLANPEQVIDYTVLQEE